MSSSTKVLDPAFQGVGQRPGTEIWRIENFQPVALQKSEYGKFYMGDCYIILQIFFIFLSFFFCAVDNIWKGGAYIYDIHFWIGRDTTQDEAGTAAIKAVELDAALGGRLMQHREPCIIPLEGGVASGFTKPEEEEFETLLYICKGKRVVRMKQNKIYQFNGANSNIQERAKALEVIQFLKEKYHEGTCDVAIVDDGKLDTESDSGEFWVLMGGFAPIGKKVTSEEDIIPESAPAKLYSITDGEVKIVEGELSKGLLENNKSYLLDCGAEVFVWVGRVTQVEERKSAIQAAEGFVVSQNRPKATRITRLIQGYETHAFKSNFDSWPAGSAAPGSEEGRGKVAAMLKQQGLGVKGMAKSAPVSEEVPPLLEGGGKMEVWCINGRAKTPLLKEDIGKFYSGDCYIILYTYHSGDRKEDYFLCCWFGKYSIEEDHNTTIQLANTMFNSLKGRPVQGRIFQGKEPPQFVALFQPMLVLKGGLSSGYKNLVAEKGVADETYTTDTIALFRVSGTSIHNNKTEQVDAVATSLNSTECFLLQSGSSIFLWHGIRPGVAVKHAKEGTESSSFWFALGGKQNYTSKRVSPETFRDPHLFSYSLNKGIEEVYNFSQDDLLTEDILILDTHAEVFIWVGHSVDPKEKQNAFDVGQKYIDMAASLDGLPLNVPLFKVSEGIEPSFFTTYFSWDLTKATVQGNSFQKKVALASALAALSSALNPSSDKSAYPDQDRSNGSGGPTQRASALAALSSAFNSSSGNKTPSKPSGTSQGSQRAAAVAALSSVLTAEKKKQKKSEVYEAQVSEDTEVREIEEPASISDSNVEESEPKQDAEQDEIGDESIQSTFSYDQLKVHSEIPVTGIDFKRREAYLSEDDFQTVFGMEKEAFYKLPKWKQDMQKKKADLF
ncbi:hypothetical protein K2173_008855 [Erythroxylum novogranatense]|uniref:HP domain-containing protein n=1 Tax=Erythroxylum novogranatense TaxID=1862640 RepID=A0AAV8U9A7_9ROSI|nr:hypothetical protein K2173_008855 [Erythroxylum novogranatense]